MVQQDGSSKVHGKRQQIYHSVCGKTEMKSQQNIKILNEICLLLQSFRKLYKLATVGSSNVLYTLAIVGSNNVLYKLAIVGSKNVLYKLAIEIGRAHV